MERTLPKKPQTTPHLTENILKQSREAENALADALVSFRIWVLLQKFIQLFNARFKLNFKKKNIESGFLKMKFNLFENKHFWILYYDQLEAHHSNFNTANLSESFVTTRFWQNWWRWFELWLRSILGKKNCWAWQIAWNWVFHCCCELLCSI